MRFGFFCDFDWGRPLGAQVDEIVELAELAAEAGFESLWTGENLPDGDSPLLPSPLIFLASVARRVRLRLGTGIILAPLREPYRLAYDSAVLDQLSDGRFVLGLGVGAPPIWNRFGIEKDDIAPTFDELLEALPRLWAGEPGFEGEHVRIEGALWPRPAQEGGIPLWVAGRVKRATRRAAVHGEAFYASTPVRLDEIEVLGKDYRANLERLGKDPAAGRVAANRIFGVAETEADVARFVEPYAMNVLRTYAGLGALRTEDGVTRTADEDLFRLFSEGIHLVGTPESVVETIRRYADAGVTDLNFRVLGGQTPVDVARRSLELFRDEVVPRLGALAERPVLAS